MKNSKSQLTNPKQQRVQGILIPFWICLLFGACLPANLWAGNMGFTQEEQGLSCEEKEKTQTTREITSDSLRWEYEAGIAVFIGNVVMNGEEGKIASSKMTVFFDKNDEVERIVGEGKVSLVREKQKGGGELIEIYPAKNLLILKNNAWISSEKAVFNGEEITLDTEKEIIHITKGVKGEIQTESTEKTDINSVP